MLGTAALSSGNFLTPKLNAASRFSATAENARYNDEAFWKKVRAQFCTSTPIINLNNAALSPHPVPVQQAHFQNAQYSNEIPSYHMWEILDRQRATMRKNLAELAGCPADEIAINRNATEALNTIIFGLPLQKGDTVIVSNLDYPYMLNAWQQRGMRDGINLKWVKLESPETDNSIVKKYEKALKEGCRVLHLTHVINWNGQILPVKRLIELAHQYGAEVVLDAAHSFAHLPYRIADLDADYYGASLHKWLCSPFGNGFLQIKKQHIPKIWPLLSAYDPKSSDIRKFEILGSRSYASEMAIQEAIDFHNTLGTFLKYERLSYLRNYWLDQVKDLSGFKMLSPNYSELEGGAIAAFQIKNQSVEAIADLLMEQYQIHVGKIQIPGLQGIRISPHIYTTLNELDQLVVALKKISQDQ